MKTLASYLTLKLSKSLEVCLTHTENIQISFRNIKTKKILKETDMTDLDSIIECAKKSFKTIDSSLILIGYKKFKENKTIRDVINIEDKELDSILDKLIYDCSNNKSILIVSVYKAMNKILKRNDIDSDIESMIKTIQETKMNIEKELGREVNAEYKDGEFIPNKPAVDIKTGKKVEDNNKDVIYLTDTFSEFFKDVTKQIDILLRIPGWISEDMLKFVNEDIDDKEKLKKRIINFLVVNICYYLIFIEDLAKLIEKYNNKYFQ